MKLQKPAPDEVEISLFGPGYGECVLIHPGDGQWIVVDSCRDPLTSVPASLAYFSEIGVDVSTAVKQVIASHWHDDHVSGLGDTFAQCKSADFVCSEAISSKEFLEIVLAYGHKKMYISPTGVDELRTVIDELSLRAKESGVSRLTPMFAVENKCLWKSRISSANSECSIYSLSPSDSAIIMSKLDISKLVPLRKEPKKNILPFSPNHTSVVLFVSVGELSVMLGADLEYSGWSAIVDSSAKPSGKASVFKIPHHGSQNGHCTKVWEEMLDSNPMAILSPFIGGSVVLPTPQDVSRICSLTESAYMTADASRGKVVKRDKAAEKTIKELGRDIKQRYRSMGHIRLRARQGSAWEVELFRGAKPLCRTAAA